MLGNLRLFRTVMDHYAVLVRISLQPFFSTLPLSARAEWTASSLPMDRDAADDLDEFNRRPLPEFMPPRGAIDYMLAVLVSLVRIERYYCLSERLYGTLAQRMVKPFRLEGSIAYRPALLERERFHACRQIGVLSLFLASAMGLDPVLAGGNKNPLPLSNWETRRAEFFAVAARHSVARDSSLGRALLSLSEGLSLATKPLRLVSSNYRGPLRDSLFVH